MKKNMLTSLFLGILVSGAALYLAFRKVPFAELGIYLSSINYLWIFPSAFASLLAFALRAFRWQIILGTEREIGFWRAFHPLMIGFMLNCILPGRAGEVARPVILQKKDHVPFSTGLATVAAERVFDVAFLMIFFGSVLYTVNIDPNLSIPFGKYHLNRETLDMVGRNMLVLCILGISGMILMNFTAVRNIIGGTIMNVPSLFFFAGADFKEKIKEKICIRLVGMMENFAAGFSLVKFPKKLAACVGLSFLIWTLSAFSYYVFSLGCPGINLSYMEMVAVMVIICFFIALPSVPGYWGLWEAGGMFAMTLFGIPLNSKEAVGFTLANHAVQIFPVVIAGLISAMFIGVNVRQISHNKTT